MHVWMSSFYNTQQRINSLGIFIDQGFDLHFRETLSVFKWKVIYVNILLGVSFTTVWQENQKGKYQRYCLIDIWSSFVSADLLLKKDNVLHSNEGKILLDLHGLYRVEALNRAFSKRL